MKKQTHELLIEHFKACLPRYKEDYFNRRREMDKVVVWMSALSTGAIGLVVFQSENIHVNDFYLKLTTLFLLLSVLSGVTFRYLIYKVEQMESSLIMDFESYCYGYSLEIGGPIEITPSHSIQDIAKSLKEDMGLDYDQWLTDKRLNREFWVDHYSKWANFWRTSEEKGLKNLGRALAPLVGKSADDGEKLFFQKKDNSKIGKLFLTYLKVCNISYLILALFFGVALIVFTVGYFVS